MPTLEASINEWTIIASHVLDPRMSFTPFEDSEGNAGIIDYPADLAEDITAARDSGEIATPPAPDPVDKLAQFLQQNPDVAALIGLG